MKQPIKKEGFTDLPDGWKFKDVEVRFGPGLVVKSITIDEADGPKQYTTPGSHVKFISPDNEELVFRVGEVPDLK
jgi:hypothetical protein